MSGAPRRNRSGVDESVDESVESNSIPEPPNSPAALGFSTRPRARLPAPHVCHEARVRVVWPVASSEGAAGLSGGRAWTQAGDLRRRWHHWVRRRGALEGSGVEIERRVMKDGAVRWRVRWRQGGRYRSQTFDRKGDAVTFGAELRRRQQLGTLAAMDMGRVTLAEYVVGTWCEAYASQLAEDMAALSAAPEQAHSAVARSARTPGNQAGDDRALAGGAARRRPRPRLGPLRGHAARSDPSARVRKRPDPVEPCARGAKCVAAAPH